MPRATTAAWLVMPPRVVRMPLAACMPWMSSGLVSIAHQDHRLALARRAPRPRRRRTRPCPRRRRARPAGRAPARPSAPWDRASDAAAGRATPARCARPPPRWSIRPFVRHVDGDLERRLRGALAGAGLQHVELALLHRELDVLHVAVMLFERVAHLEQLARTPPASPLPSPAAAELLAFLPAIVRCCGVRMPATTSSPCALTRYSP